ncbi:MAG: flagellar M-ring protein FliF [Hungatella sp.]|nr:flagellar M-ring protein FliF [Hungatella sp.]
MQNFKESWQNMSDKTRKIIIIIAGVTVAVALIAILALNLGGKADYSTLFTGLNQDEAQQVVSLLQEQGITYQYNDSNGSIRVPAASVEQTRVNLLSQGYPKSGFAYDMYLDNTGLMSTESDKKQLTRYELQDRLGATIRMFEGVQDAKVNISEGVEQQYALSDTSSTPATASVIITMQKDSTLTPEKAQAVKNLISHSVRGMNFAEVSVFDANTMLEVSGEEEGSASGATTDLASLTTLVESNIAANVRRVLEQLYGNGNVAVSVKGTLNMESLIQEITQYTTPDKIDEQDKTGFLQQEDVTTENTSSSALTASGVVGADANADTPRYTNDDGTGQNADTYYNGTASRVWLYNVLKEQRQINPGVLEDVSIGVVINTDDTTTVTDQELMRLVANSAGIPVETVNDKVTVVRAMGPTRDVVQPPVTPVTGPAALIQAVPLPILIAIAAGILLILLLLILLLVRRKKKKVPEVVMEGDEFIEGDQMSEGEFPVGEELQTEDGQPVTMAGPDEEEDEFAKNEEILNLRMQRSLRLKQNIGDFVDQNPQIAAKLIQSWLRGEEGDGDVRDQRTGTRRKQ